MVQVGEHKETLEAGDSIYYNSDSPHGMIAVGGKDCLFYAIVLNPSGEPIPVAPTDRITIAFEDRKGDKVAEFESVGTASPTITIDAEKSARFPEGVYGILAKFNSDNVTTLLKNRKVVVE